MNILLNFAILTVGVSLASYNFSSPPTTSNQPPAIKEGRHTCYVELGPKVQRLNNSCAKHRSDEKCRIFNETCKWDIWKQACLSRVFSICQRDAKSLCETVQIKDYPYRGKFNIHLKKFRCQADKPGEALARID